MKTIIVDDECKGIFEYEDGNLMRALFPDVKGSAEFVNAHKLIYRQR